MKAAICKGNFNNGPMLIDSLKDNLITLFVEDQYNFVRANIVEGHDSFFVVPELIYRAYQAELVLEEKNALPIPRKIVNQ